MSTSESWLVFLCLESNYSWGSWSNSRGSDRREWFCIRLWNTPLCKVRNIWLRNIWTPEEDGMKDSSLHWKLKTGRSCTFILRLWSHLSNVPISYHRVPLHARPRPTLQKTSSELWCWIATVTLLSHIFPELWGWRPPSKVPWSL